MRQLVGDIAASPPIELDEAAHVRGVMARLEPALDRPPARHAVPRATRIALASAIAAAAAVLVLFVRPAGPGAGPPAAVQPRGGATPSSIERDVRLQALALRPQPHGLRDGSPVGRDTPFTAAFRNLGATPRHLLFFAVDAGSTVRWIAPTFERLGSDPAAVVLPSTRDEQVLPSSVAFDDLPLGPMRLVSVVSERSMRVSEVERLPAADLADAALQRRFADAVVRSVVVQVVTAPAQGDR